METENDYLKTVNEMKEQFDLKELEVANEKKKSEFYERELLAVFGSIRLLEKSYKEDYLPIETMLITLELLEHRLEHVFEIICERGVMDD